MFVCRLFTSYNAFVKSKKNKKASLIQLLTDIGHQQFLVVSICRASVLTLLCSALMSTRSLNRKNLNKLLFRANFRWLVTVALMMDQTTTLQVIEITDIT